MTDTFKSAVLLHPFFHGMKQEHLEIIAESAVEAQYHPGDVLFREREPAGHLFLIQSGRVALETVRLSEEPALVQVLGTGDVLGWSWLYPPYLWHFQARAWELSRTIKLSGSHLLKTAEMNHDFGYELMRRVTQIVVRRLQAARGQVLVRQIESVLDD